MKKIININGEIDETTSEHFIEKLNDFLSVKSVTIEIHINSIGGNCCDASQIIYLINSTPEIKKIVAAGFIGSCAFEIFFLSKKEKILLPETGGMYHGATIGINIDHNGNATEDKDRYHLESTKQTKERTLSVCDIANMTAEEKHGVATGADVYFTPDRLAQMLNGKPI